MLTGWPSHLTSISDHQWHFGLEVEIHPSGRVLLNSTSGELTSLIFDVSLDLFGTYDITRGHIYAGSLGEAPAQFLLCREWQGQSAEMVLKNGRCKNGTIKQERLATRSVVEKTWHKLWIHLFRCLQSLRCQRRPEATRSVRLLLYLSDYGWNVLKDRRWHECLWLFLCFCCRSTGKKSRRGLSVCWC